MEVKCSYDEITEIKNLKPHPKNPNKHSPEQIERLAKILQYQGIRRPIRVSRLSGQVTAGHGLLSALLYLGEKTCPVNYQAYESEEQEYADIVADNSIASWADLDFGEINFEIPGLGPDFDVDMLGLKNFFIDAADRHNDPSQEWQGMPEFTQESKEAFRSVVVHFHDQEAIELFSKLLNKPILETTRYLWFPEMIIEKVVDKRYSAE